MWPKAPDLITESEPEPVVRWPRNPIADELDRLGFKADDYYRRTTGHEIWAVIPVGDICPNLAGRPARVLMYFTFEDMHGSLCVHLQHRSRCGGWHSETWPFGCLTRKQLEVELTGFVEAHIYEP